jgi:hypothetical protein
MERMKIMARHGSASVRKEASTRKEASARKETAPSKETIRGKQTTVGKEKSHVIDAALKRRARLLITNSSIPRQTRSLIPYALEIRDPYLAQVVRRVEAGEMTIERLHVE